ncbi:MAG: 2Fe-2S iron-sulfur cluster-binding protein, partial [Syntrophobacteraceae bacterium]
MSTSVRFVGRKEPVFVDEGSTILDAVSGGGFSIPADCGGLGKCGRCRVKVVEGAPALTPSKAETARIGAEDIESGIRLACCHEVTDGLLIEIVEEIYRKEGYKRLGVGIGEPLPLGPAFRSTPLGDGNLEEAFDEAGLTGKDWAALFPDVSEADDGRNAGTPEPPRRVALTSPSGRVFALKREPLSLYGVAVDLGTTTVAAYLCDFQTGQILDVQTARNPQVTFGADVMSRILASQKPKDARALKQLACETISSCIQMLCKENGIAREDLVETILVGNPTMVHLLIGAPARGLGIAPYRPLFHGALELKA